MKINLPVRVKTMGVRQCKIDDSFEKGKVSQKESNGVRLKKVLHRDRGLARLVAGLPEQKFAVSG
jgi:hypothetical protein